MIKNKKIWFLSEYFYPVCTSTGYYITEIAKYLANANINVGAISSNNRYRLSDQYTELKSESYEGIDIIRAVLKGKKNRIIKYRIFNMLSTSFKIFYLMLKNIKKGDLVVSVTNPPFLIPFLYLFYKIKKNEYIIIVHDLFPENLVSIKLVNNNSILYKLLRNAYHFFYIKAKLIITLGRDMHKRIECNLNGKIDKIVTIQNWADNKTVFPLDDSAFLSELNLENKIVLQFAGNIGKTQNIEIILYLAKHCTNKMIHFLFIGTGDKVNLIKEYIAEDKKKNVTYIDYVDRKDQNLFLNACDIGLVTLQDGMFGLGVPSKAYNIMAVGKPILFIGEKGTEIFQSVVDNNIGWAFESSQYNDILILLNTLKKYDGELIKKGNNARKMAETTYSKDNILYKYLKVIENEL